MLNWLTNYTLETSRWRTREHRILVDQRTFSAAEDFLVAADAMPHVTTGGRRSGGSTASRSWSTCPAV